MKRTRQRVDINVTELNQVVEEAAHACDGAIPFVDLRVDMSVISGRDNCGGRIVVAIAPGFEAEPRQR